MSDLRTAMRSRAPPFAYGAVLLLGAVMAPFLLSVYDGVSPYGGRRILSTSSVYSLKDALVFSYLQKLEDVDRSIEERARADDDPDRCSRVFLYLPDPFSNHGHGSQINTYIVGAVTSTYLDRAMVLVERPQNKYAGGSQFGCPVDAFRESEAGWEVHEDFPYGFSRLVDHPAWLSRGCGVPCGEKYSYADWNRIANEYDGRGDFKEITCKNPDGKKVNVVVTSGGKLLNYYRGHDVIMARSEPAKRAAWATNLGATPREAEFFSNMKNLRHGWDYVQGLMNKAGFLRLQPWIARDVELLLKTFDLPIGEEYSAIHVRRGDKLVFESRQLVVGYWKSKGHTDLKNLPTDYIPFEHYLSMWDGPEVCPRDEKGTVQILKHNVYVATDDPIVVRQEIEALPNHIDENTIMWNDCHQVRFFFNPTDDDAFHLNGNGEEGFANGSDADADSCFKRYHRNIVSIGDMMLLVKAKTFIGEFNSNWGRAIRTLRVRLVAPDDGTNTETNDNVAAHPRDVNRGNVSRVLDTRVAFGSTVPRTPGK